MLHFISAAGTYLQSQIVVWVFLLAWGSLFVWILRLHFSSRFVNFDLTKLIEQADGSPDGEKIRMWASYLAGLFAFFFLLHRDYAAFNGYAPLFLGLTFAHLVANRITARRPDDDK